jgi:adenosine kinase
MTALVCGSFAFDTIMVFNDHFKNHIIPDKVHMLNVSFLVPDLRREFGGCAGNIAYNLKLLGDDVYPMATVGADFTQYGEWMKRFSISTKYIQIIADKYTAQAYITTDMDDNQITAFHPGAMNDSNEQAVPDDGISIGLISPEGKQGMIDHAKQFADKKIPFIFDPGQGLPMFNSDELNAFIDQATWISLNSYESEMLQQTTGLSIDDVRQRVDAVIVTKGGSGSTIYTKDKEIEIPPAEADDVIDPTGCGDAYRAGLLYGLTHDFDWETTGRLAGLLGAIKIAQAGTQNHHFTRDDIEEQYKEQYGSELTL